MQADQPSGARSPEVDDRLLESQRLESIGLLAGGVAHHFNNLLTVIVGRASLALMKLGAAHPARDDLDELLVAARHATHLTRQMLAYAGRGRFEVRALDVAEHVTELVDLLSATLPKRTQVSLQATVGETCVEADLGQFQQVVVNLILNAAEAMGELGGTIHVTSRNVVLDGRLLLHCVGADAVAAGAYVCVEVRDTGMGMDEGTRARIFEPFFSTKALGRGLGLAAVRGILRSHHGALTVESAPGHGSCFRVYFPASNVNASRSRPIVAAFTHVQGTVLVVDDEEGVRAVARAALEHVGLDVVEAVGVADAGARFLATPDAFDLVLLDITMGDGNGADLAESLLTLRPNQPVLLSSGFDEREVSSRFAGVGHVAFLAKPYSPARCASAVLTLIEQTRTARAAAGASEHNGERAPGSSSRRWVPP